jgi:protein-tyrosine phosphatase
MAEGLARKLLGNLVEAESAGVKAENGNPATEEAIQIMRSRFGVDLSKHRSRNVSALTSLEGFDQSWLQNSRRMTTS